MRKITDLQPNEAIYIRTKKEAKVIAKLIGWDIQTCEWMKGKFILRKQYCFHWEHSIDAGSELPASNFLPETKPSLKKRVKILEMQVGELMDNDIRYPISANHIFVNDAKQELGTLRFNWCVKITDENRTYLSKWCGIEIHPEWKYVNDMKGVQDAVRDCTEITFDQFKKWVLKEDSEQLEVGKWYIYPKGAIMYNEEDGSGYGISTNKTWCDEARWLKHKSNGLDYRLATNEEVSAALIAEAKKRGFVEGVYHDLLPNTLVMCHNSDYSLIDNTLYFNNKAIFNNGKWADIVQAEFDWSKPGQRLIDHMGCVVLTTGVNNDVCFYGTIIVDSEPIMYGVGYFSEHWMKDKFKPYTGEPIVLK